MFGPVIFVYYNYREVSTLWRLKLNRAVYIWDTKACSPFGGYFYCVLDPVLEVLLYTVKPPNNGDARDPAFNLSFVERLSSFGGYFVWSVYSYYIEITFYGREVCLFRNVLNWSVHAS